MAIKNVNASTSIEFCDGKPVRVFTSTNRENAAAHVAGYLGKEMEIGELTFGWSKGKKDWRYATLAPVEKEVSS